MFICLDKDSRSLVSLYNDIITSNQTVCDIGRRVLLYKFDDDDDDNDDNDNNRVYDDEGRLQETEVT